MQSVLTRAAAAAALALAFAAPGGAQDTSGYIGAGVSRTDVEDGGDDIDGLNVDAALYVPIASSLNLQLNAYSFHYDEDDVGDDSDLHGGDLHLVLRDRGHAFGGFASVIDQEDSDTTTGVGGEGEVYAGDWTFGGAGGWFESDDFDDLYGGCGYGRLYAASNIALEGHASLVSVDYGPVDDEVFSAGLGAEYQFEGSGLSLRGGVDRSEWDDSDQESTRAGIGVRYNFGTRSLVSRDRGGAGMPGSACILGGMRP